MPVGGWASALGAALQGGAQMYQSANRDQQQLELEKQRATDAHMAAMLQKAILSAQVEEIPKKHAEGDVDRQFARDGIAAFNDPGFLKNNELAGQPIQTRNVMGARLKQIEGNPAGNLDLTPVDTQSGMASKMGVAPNTGAVIPSHLLLQDRKDQQGLAQNDFITQYIRNQMEAAGGGGGNSPAAPVTPSAFGPATPVTPPVGVDDPGFPNGVKQYVGKLKQKYPGDSGSARAELQRAWPEILSAHPGVDASRVLSNFPASQGNPQLGQTPPGLNLGQEPPFEDPKVKAERVMGKLSGVDPGEPPHESAQHKVFTKTAEAAATASFKPPAQAIQKEAEAYAKARILIPQLRESLMNEVLDKNDPTGQHANPIRMGIHTIASHLKNDVYNSGYPMSDNASKATQLSGLFQVIGTSPYMAGSRSMQMFDKASKHLTDPASTPESRLQRLNEIEQIFPEFEKSMPGAALEYQRQMQALQQQGQGGQQTPQGQAPGQAQAQAPPAVTNKSRTLAEVQALANIQGVDPKVIIQKVIAAGGTVTK